MYTYDDSTFSDLYKDVYGFRPRGAWMEEWNERTPRQKQELWNALCDELEENEKAARKAETEALDEFRINVREVMNICNCSWTKAVNHLADAEKIDIVNNDQEFDYFLWNQGIGFQDRQNIYKLYKEAS